MDRAIVFVDGSNWYHGCVALGLKNPARLNFAKISRKLVEARRWTATRYYVGEVPPGLIRELAACSAHLRLRRDWFDGVLGP